MVVASLRIKEIKVTDGAFGKKDKFSVVVCGLARKKR
jgi:hypothetical protein